MSYAQQMIQTHPSSAGASDARIACIEACFDCARAYTVCADACLGEKDPKSLARCIRLSLDCAGDVCATTGTIVSRQTGTDPAIVRAALRGCGTACKLSGDECEVHGTHGVEHCRVCAEACRRCELACDALIGEYAA